MLLGVFAARAHRPPLPATEERVGSFPRAFFWPSRTTAALLQGFEKSGNEGTRLALHSGCCGWWEMPPLANAAHFGGGYRKRPQVSGHRAITS